MERELIRLQCYEGIDAAHARYEWNYPRQLLALREAGDRKLDLYSEIFPIERPLVILISNQTRSLHEALRRRCLYHWIAYPSVERESEIIQARASEVTAQAARAVAALRGRGLAKPPGVTEAIDWANAATLLEEGGGQWPLAFRRAIGAALKDEDDLADIAAELDAIIAAACA